MKAINLCEKIKAQIKNFLPVLNTTEIITNIIHNWTFIVSAMAFFYLNGTLAIGYVIGLIIAFLIVIIIASQYSSLWKMSQSINVVWRLISVVSAVGICLAAQESFYATWSFTSDVLDLSSRIPIKIDISGAIGLMCAMCALYFVYLCVLLFWNRITRTIKQTELLDGISAFEIGVYLFLAAVTICYMTYSFTKSQSFYGTNLSYDVIYTSDSPSLVKGNVYMSLTHPENDLRQPLFAVFSAPFFSIPYLVARLIGASASIRAILMNSVQIIIMFASNFIIAKMIGLSSAKRIIFMVLSSCTYAYLLFSLMMEQYIVAFFWLALCVYLISEKRQYERIAIWGATGTLMTSVVLLPFMSGKSPIKEFKTWLMNTVKYGLEFVVFLLAFCRFDVIYYLGEKVSQLTEYTGKTITFVDKLTQYTTFICNCFIAPNANVNTTAYDYASWQLDVATGIDYIGIFILLLSIIGFVLNREKMSSQIAMGWICFSIVLLLIVGWGTKENGLILYSLYFGWAFLVLLFQLVEKVGEMIRFKYLLHVVFICAAIALLYINIPAIIEMLRFAIAYYPV